MSTAPEATAAAPAFDDDEAATDGGLEAQLHALYAERERLFRALGTADADAILAMIASLASQLRDVYAEREAAFRRGAAPPMARDGTSSER